MDKDTRITIARLTLEDIKGITLTGNRWTDSLGVTYHSTYVSCLVDVEKANELRGDVELAANLVNDDVVYVCEEDPADWK